MIYKKCIFDKKSGDRVKYGYTVKKSSDRESKYNSESATGFDLVFSDNLDRVDEFAIKIYLEEILRLKLFNNHTKEWFVYPNDDKVLKVIDSDSTLKKFWDHLCSLKTYKPQIGKERTLQNEFYKRWFNHKLQMKRA